jgi:hypothetical protein
MSPGVAITQPQSRIETTRQVVRYRLIDLGTLGGPNSEETVEFPDINNHGCNSVEMGTGDFDNICRPRLVTSIATTSWFSGDRRLG